MSGERRPISVGLVVGLVGYACVALLYAALDLAAGRGVLHTVDLLGKSVFFGLRDPAVLTLPVQPDSTAILLYNGLHLVVSIAIGLTVVGLVDRARRRPETARTALLIIVAGFVVTIAVLGFLTGSIRPVLPWWSIVVSNSLAVVGAGSYLMRSWPDTWETLRPGGVMPTSER